MITEIYVPRAALGLYLGEVNVIYGTVRLIRRDDESAAPLLAVLVRHDPEHLLVRELEHGGCRRAACAT